jgi:hypothetical protein
MLIIISIVVLVKNIKRISRIAENDYVRPMASDIYNIIKKLKRDDIQNETGIIINDVSINILANTSMILMQSQEKNRRNQDNMYELEALKRVAEKINQIH